MGNWPSDYVATGITSGFGGKVVSNNWNEGGFGVTDSVMISGHRTVATKADLYSIPSQILSSKASNKATNNNGTDALGQLWYVEDEKSFYQLIDWGKRTDTSGIGWSKTNIKATNAPGGGSNTQYANTNGSGGDCIKDLTLTGDGTLTYNGWNLNMSNDQLATGVRLKYTKSNGTANTPLTTIPLVDEGAKTSGVISSAQYKSLLDRISYLETWTVWQSRVGTDTNTSTYLWSGSLTDFNKLETKPTDTTFIVTN